MIHILIIDSVVILRKHFGEKLGTQPELEVIGDGAPEQLWALLAAHVPDILLIDFHPYDSFIPPIPTVKTLIQQYPGVKLLIYSDMNEGTLLQELIRLGIHGCIYQNDVLDFEPAELVRSIMEGKHVYSKTVQKAIRLEEANE